MTRDVSAIPLPLSPRDARRALKSVLSENDWRGDIDGVVLAVHEALVNAESHGQGLSRVAASVDGDELVVDVCDAGAGFVGGWPASTPPDPLAERGRGLWLIDQIARRVEVHQGPSGVCLRLRFVGNG
ncbi:MAG: serine/threonine-protein kinase RsbW [Actinomycetota bacterium]|nr:serine/threonine-protein kinase RsbW [Actinomycetota bacterium]MEA2844025.1 serine/threonine-protein kinase RsbW [Actinomycetota bacterium]